MGKTSSRRENTRSKMAGACRKKRRFRYFYRWQSIGCGCIPVCFCVAFNFDIVIGPRSLVLENEESGGNPVMGKKNDMSDPYRFNRKSDYVHSPSESNINVCPLGNAEEETLDYSNVVFGRSLSNKAVNKGGLKRFFEAKWQNNAGVKVEDYNDGIFILTFDRQSVKSRVLRGQPWYFSDRNCLDLMEKIEEGYNPLMNYDDQIKTAGLEHMIPSIPLAINWHGDINNTSLSRRLLGATRSHEEDASVSFSEKRVKVNDDGKGFPTNDFMEKGEQSENKRVRGETKGDKEELKAKEFLFMAMKEANEGFNDRYL
ncbi:hypothetical protein G4B88_019918 [Cannabis sativa]|uniref:DUF4283 domain-containing protein n=1 Tax=Cannabis sativa TaxID=3483 RepID=A0A7J6HSF3_CANSA|nr:hypothetical protein G4B88_019918 [Cannabis sativa]